jgi:hypothetical protein
MRPDLVFSDESVSPSLFFTTLAKKPLVWLPAGDLRNGRNGGTALGPEQQ